MVDDVDPIVEAQPRVADASLRIPEAEPGVEHVPNIGFAVAVGVFEEEDVGRGGGDHAALPRRHSFDLQEVLSEHGSAVNLAVAVSVFEVRDTALRGLAGRRIVGVVGQLGDVESAILIERNLDGIEHIGLCREWLDAEAVDDFEGLESLGWIERFAVRQGWSARSKQQRHTAKRA